MNPVFSIILPVYNEAARIPWLVENYRRALDTLEEPWELLLVINGSRDDSYSVARGLMADHPQVRAFELKEAGWGRAVKLGIQEARGQNLCYTNSARTELSDLLMALRYSKVNPDVMVKASRIVRDSWFRKLGSALYNFEFRLLFRVPVWDVNGTPKVLPRDLLDKLAPISSFSDGDLIDAELVKRCFNRRLGILEMPVLCTRRYGGKSTTNLKTAWRLYTGLLRMR